MRGGPPLGEVRRVLASKGRVRLSGTAARLFADVDPGEPELPVVALDMIVRSDAAGLERALLSALPFVDEIVIGVDGRSDEATHAVAAAFADVVHVFHAEDIGLSSEEWLADKIHFANARNLGRARVTAPWTLFVDSDEYIRRALDFRAALHASEYGSYEVAVVIGGMVNQDGQRLARTSYRWWSQSHNQLAIDGPRAAAGTTGIGVEVVQDLTLRSEGEIARRQAQRDDGVDALRAEAAKGQVPALFHLAKHLLCSAQLEEGAKLAEDYRLRVEPHGPFTEERAWLATQAAFAFYKNEELGEAERWALRILLDGPRIEAFCLLGDLAEDQADLEQALTWYEIACIAPDVGSVRWHHFTGRRFGRRDGLRVALGRHPDMPGPPLSQAELDKLAGRTPADGDASNGVEASSDAAG
jgi:hypothetical protein